VLDHSGAVFRHGFVEDHVEWTLDPERGAESPTHTARGEAGSRYLECTQCGTLRVAGLACGHCGFLPKRPPRDVPFGDGELGRVDRDRRARPDLLDPATRQRWHRMLTYIAEERGYKPGWTAHKFKEKFGSWPSWGAHPQPIEPTPEVRSWVRSRQIAFAKSRSVA
jgi:DNA repair protein RadD